MDDMLTTAEAADYLKISRSTLNQYRQTGRGPAFYKMGPQFVRYARAELDQWARQRRCNSTNEFAGAAI